MIFKLLYHRNFRIAYITVGCTRCAPFAEDCRKISPKDRSAWNIRALHHGWHWVGLQGATARRLPG